MKKVTENLISYLGLSEKGHLLAHVTRLCFGLIRGMP